MNKSLRTVAVILIVCIMIAIPIIAGKNVPDGIKVPSGEQSIVTVEETEDNVNEPGMDFPGKSEEKNWDKEVSEEADDKKTNVDVEESNVNIEDNILAEEKEDADNKEIISEGEKGIAREMVDENEDNSTQEKVDEERDEEEKDEEEKDANVEKITTCSLKVSCQSILDNMDKLKKKKKVFVPENGILFMEENIEFTEGESAFDVLCRKMKNNNIHIDYVKNNMFNSVYVKGVGNIYEFDCGGMSGWLYKINGEKMSVGSSQYTLKENDKIEFYYTCNYSKDL